MKKILFFASFLLCFEAYAKQYPNVTGQILIEGRADHITSTNKSGVDSNAGYINLEPDFALNFNKNWSIKSGWRILPVRTRQYQYPERSRTILGEKIGINRGFNQDDTGIVVEELKLNFENEDLEFAIGKYNPTFATMYRRNKRIGLFVTDITEDYELRGRLGGSIAANLEDSKITINAFFTDTTGLSDSAIKHRKKRSRDDGIAGNTGTLSSYSITMEGRDLFGINNLFYNFGYRSLGVENEDESSEDEVAYTANLEYLYRVSRNTSIIPLVEIVKISNFTGRKNRDAEYITASLIGQYGGWNLSAATVFRNLDNNYATAPVDKNRDRLFQVNVGYKFSNNIAIDLSRASLKEDGNKGSLLGVIIGYMYEF